MRLELALLNFFTVFRDVYAIAVRLTHSFSSLTSQAISDASALPGYSISGLKEGVGTLTHHSHPQACNHYFEKMGLGDYTSVMNAIVEKICSNLRYWGDNDQVINASLKLFLSLSHGYQGCKLLLQLESVEFMLQNHTVRVAAASHE